MDEPYAIEVLYVVNPHLLIVESQDERGVPVIQQIGIYGILPVNKTVDIDGQVVAERCENWPVAASFTLREFFADHKHGVYFVPIEDEIRSSIFDENTHQFGDIFLSSNKMCISDYLIKTGVAEKDECAFHQKLTSGKIKTKLNSTRTEEVINAIKKYYQKQKKVKHDWQKTINRHTSLHQESKKISSNLTEKNLELFEKNTNRMKNVMETIERKERDLDLCKDADAVGLGCGSTRHSRSSHANTTLHKKSLNKENDDFNPHDVHENEKIHHKNDHEMRYRKKTIDKCYVHDENQNISEKSHSQNVIPKLYQKYKHENPHQDISSQDQSLENWIKRNYEEDIGSKRTTQQSTKFLKVKERLRVFCPDMEMCGENLKNLVPTKVIEDYTENSTKVIQVDNSKINYVVRVEDKIDTKTVNLDSVSKLSNKTNYDDTDSQTEVKNVNHCSIANSQSKIHNTFKTKPTENRLVSSFLCKRLQALKEAQKRQADSSFSSNSDTSVKDTSSSTAESKTEPEQCNVEIEARQLEQTKPTLALNITKIERNVDPFKNLDGSKSVFVEKLITPSLMVHTKNDHLIIPQCEMRDIPFKADIHSVLKNLRVYKPMRLQSVSWRYILRGHSVFMTSAAGNGKTLGYVPAVCNLVRDSINDVYGVGPICVIVCATSLSVTEVENYCKKFLALEERIIACYPGIDIADVTTALLNGCHVLISTAPMLVSLLEVDFGVDLRRLMILVFDDCERLSEVYSPELSKILQHVKAMLKKRPDKLLKVQYVIASRQWCDFMTPLAKKAPDTLIAIGAFQECVLYSKAKTSVTYVKNKESKVNHVIEFLKEVDSSKRTVIVCRDDDEVVLLESALKKMNHTVFACNNTMNLHDLYQLNEAWGNYREPVLGPILICCDGNLTHLNITNSNHMVHFSLPPLLSMFCKRFSVLNDNYASIFVEASENVKIKIFLDETNVEQLPKILHFVKRCTKESFPMLDNVLKDVLVEKDLKKAKAMVSICNSLLMLGECIDMSHCVNRHTVFNQLDKSKDWMPKQGVITFKITHFDTAVTYSARVLSKTTKVGTTKYPNNYNTLSLKMGMYYSKDINRKLHGTPKLGDICAVAVKESFFERCQVMKIIPSDSRKSVHVLINLIDEEKLTLTSDVHLYYLPDEFKVIETHMVKIRLANIQPKDKDVTFSVAATKQIRSIAEHDYDNVVYIRGRVVMTLGNTIFIDTAEACVDLSSLGETVVKCDIRKELLSRHAEVNPQHIKKLQELGGITSPADETELKVNAKVQKRVKWAHLDRNELSTVYLSSAIDASMIFVRLAKFEQIIDLLHSDIKKYVDKAPELESDEIYVGNIILAEYPDDKTYERAMIKTIVDEKRVECFFVDHGDKRQVRKEKLRPITDDMLHRIPFQAIECRLIGVKPPGDADTWPEFSTCWLEDFCYEDNDGKSKYLFLKYFTKERGTATGGHKYGVVLFDTSSDQDVLVNKKMIELNLAKENKHESKYIDEPLTVKLLTKATDSSSDKDDTSMNESFEISNIKDLISIQSEEQSDRDDTNHLARNILFEKPIRSIPLVNDSDSDDFDKWDVNVDKGLLGMFGQPSQANVMEFADTPQDNNDHDGNNTCFENDLVPNKVKSDGNNDIASDCSKELSKIRTRISRIENSKKDSEIQVKSPMLESQSDSDDIEIGIDGMAAVNIFKSELANKDFTEKSLKNTELLKYEAKYSEQETTSDNIKKHVFNASIKNDTLDSDDLSSAASELQKQEANTQKVTEIDTPRKPKLIWRQNKNTITVKIILIGVEKYNLEIKERNLRFSTWHNDTLYEFDFVLYGVVNAQKSVHSNKGQYIQVTLVKMLQRNWLNLTKDCSAKKWIVYDVDAIDFSSDEEEESNEALKAIKQIHEKVDSESEDEDFKDDLNFKYKKHL